MGVGVNAPTSNTFSLSHRVIFDMRFTYKAHYYRRISLSLSLSLSLFSLSFSSLLSHSLSLLFHFCVLTSLRHGLIFKGILGNNRMRWRGEREEGEGEREREIGRERGRERIEG